VRGGPMRALRFETSAALRESSRPESARRAATTG
jgi:hypothetical protein